MNQIPQKKLTDKDLAEIVSRLIYDNFLIDDAEFYQEFLVGLAKLLTDCLGGDVVSACHDPVSKSWQVTISHNDEVPDGGILCEYDKENAWPEVCESSEANIILVNARRMITSLKSQGWTREMFLDELDKFLSGDEPLNHVATKYLAVWGEGYIEIGHPVKSETVGQEFFTNDRGYNDEEIQRLFGLAIGESCQFFENGFHTVVRIS